MADNRRRSALDARWDLIRRFVLIKTADPRPPLQ